MVFSDPIAAFYSQPHQTHNATIENPPSAVAEGPTAGPTSTPTMVVRHRKPRKRLTIAKLREQLRRELKKIKPKQGQKKKRKQGHKKKRKQGQKKTKPKRRQKLSLF
jgi:hypothetical protein